jgi:hypothetical protein
MKEADKKIEENYGDEKSIDFKIEDYLKEIKLELPQNYLKDIKIDPYFSDFYSKIQKSEYIEDTIIHEKFKSQPAERRKLPVCRFWSMPWKHSGYTLILMKHDSIPHMGNLPKDINIPALIKLKEKNSFFVYGVSEKNDLQVKALNADNSLIEQLNIFYTDGFYEIHVSPIENDKIYNAITAQKLHIKMPPELKTLCIHTITSNIIEKGAKYHRGELLPEEVNNQITKKINDVSTGITYETILDKPIDLSANKLNMLKK